MIKMEKLKKQINDYQLYTGNTYMQYEQDTYNSYQNYLYKRALYGIQAIDEKELTAMCSKKKQRIVNVYKRAQSVLNIAKQKVTIHYTNLLFKQLFPTSPFTEMLLKESETDISFKNTLTFKDLNMKKEDIIFIFMSEGILPKNFLNLTKEPVTLPRLKNEKT